MVAVGRVHDDLKHFVAQESAGQALALCQQQSLEAWMLTAFWAVFLEPNSLEPMSLELMSLEPMAFLPQCSIAAIGLAMAAVTGVTASEKPIRTAMMVRSKDTFCSALLD